MVKYFCDRCGDEIKDKKAGNPAGTIRNDDDGNTRFNAGGHDVFIRKRERK